MFIDHRGEFMRVSAKGLRKTASLFFATALGLQACGKSEHASVKDIGETSGTGDDVLPTRLIRSEGEYTYLYDCEGRLPFHRENCLANKRQMLTKDVIASLDEKFRREQEPLRKRLDELNANVVKGDAVLRRIEAQISVNQDEIKANASGQDNVAARLSAIASRVADIDRQIASYQGEIDGVNARIDQEPGNDALRSLLARLEAERQSLVASRAEQMALQESTQNERRDLQRASVSLLEGLSELAKKKSRRLEELQGVESDLPEANELRSQIAHWAILRGQVAPVVAKTRDSVIFRANLLQNDEALIVDHIIWLMNWGDGEPRFLWLNGRFLPGSSVANMSVQVRYIETNLGRTYVDKIVTKALSFHLENKKTQATLTVSADGGSEKPCHLRATRDASFYCDLGLTILEGNLENGKLVLSRYDYSEKSNCTGRTCYATQSHYLVEKAVGDFQ